MVVTYGTEVKNPVVLLFRTQNYRSPTHYIPSGNRSHYPHILTGPVKYTITRILSTTKLDMSCCIFKGTT
jgi:hypothetical protein